MSMAAGCISHLQAFWVAVILFLAPVTSQSPWEALSWEITSQNRQNQWLRLFAFDEKSFIKFYECLCQSDTSSCDITLDTYGLSSLNREMSETPSTHSSYLCKLTGTQYTDIVCERATQAQETASNCLSHALIDKNIKCSHNLVSIIWEEQWTVLENYNDKFLRITPCEGRNDTAGVLSFTQSSTDDDKYIIIGVVLGIVVVAAVVAVIFGVIWWRRRNKASMPIIGGSQTTTTDSNQSNVYFVTPSATDDEHIYVNAHVFPKSVRDQAVSDTASEI